MTKDLLSVIRQDDGGEGNRGSVNEGAHEMQQIDPEMADFFAQVDSIRASIEDLQSKIAQVRVKQSELISAPRQDARVKQEVDELTNEIKVVASKSRSKLKALEQETHQVEAEDPAMANVRIRKTQLSNLSRRLIDTMSDYNGAQIEYSIACKSQLKRKMEIADCPVNDDQLNDMLESGNSDVFTQGLLMNTQQARQNLADIEAQHKDIRKLEEDIVALSNLITDISVLVHDQGEMFDKIDYNVSATKDHVEEAKAQTNKAVIYQKQYNKKKIIIIAVVVSIVVLLVIILIASLAPR